MTVDVPAFPANAEAARLGYLRRDDPAVPQLQQLLSGPDPWCPFFI
jgi:hypothetical protein